MGITHIKGQPLNKGRGRHGSMMRNTMIAKKSIPQWMLDAVKKYDIPLKNLQKAYEIDPLIKVSFEDGCKRWLVSKGNCWITTDYFPTDKTNFTIYFNSVNYRGLPFAAGNGSARFDFGASDAYFTILRRGASVVNIPRTVLALNTPYRVVNVGNDYYFYNKKDVLQKKYTVNNKVTFTTPTEMYFFVARTEPYACQIGMCWFHNSGKTERLFIPMNNNGIAGMYELKQGLFLKKGGEGTLEVFTHN